MKISLVNQPHEVRTVVRSRVRLRPEEKRNLNSLELILYVSQCFWGFETVVVNFHESNPIQYGKRRRSFFKGKKIFELVQRMMCISKQGEQIKRDKDLLLIFFVFDRLKKRLNYRTSSSSRLVFSICRKFRSAPSNC